MHRMIKVWGEDGFARKFELDCYHPVYDKKDWYASHARCLHCQDIMPMIAPFRLKDDDTMSRIADQIKKHNCVAGRIYVKGTIVLLTLKEKFSPRLPIKATTVGVVTGHNVITAKRSSDGKRMVPVHNVSSYYVRLLDAGKRDYGMRIFPPGGVVSLKEVLQFALTKGESAVAKLVSA